LFEVKDAIIKYHIDLPKNYRGQILTKSDCKKIGKLTSVLGLLADATEYFGSEQQVTCSAVLPLEAFFIRLLKVEDEDSKLKH